MRNEKYLLLFYPKNCSDRGTRYYLWKYYLWNQVYHLDEKMIFSCKTKYELRIFMDLNGLKVVHCNKISRDYSCHNNKIVYASFSVNIIKDN